MSEKRKKQSKCARRRLLEALDRMILAAKQAEAARAELLKQSQGGRANG